MMKNTTENIDRYFQQTFENYEAEPDHSVWEKISKVLAQKKQKKTIFFVSRIAAGIALLTALGITLYITGIGTGEKSPDTAFKPETQSMTSSGQITTETIIPEAKTLHSQQPVPVKSGPEKNAMISNKELKVLAQEITIDTDETDKNIASSEIREKSHRAAALSAIESIGYEAVPVLTSNADQTFAHTGTASDYEFTVHLNNESDLNNGSDIPVRSRWKVGGEFAPLYSYRYIKSDYLDQQLLNKMNSAENGLLAYAGGINISFSVNERIAIQTGIHYSRYGQQKEHVTAHQYETDGHHPDLFETDYISILNSTGIIVPSSGVKPDNILSISTPSETLSDDAETDLTAIQYFDFLELPLIFKYKFINRKLDFKISGGMITNLMVGNKVYLKENKDLTLMGKTEDVRQVNYIGMLGIGFEYPLLSYLTFNLEPQFRYYLNPIDKTQQINVHPYAFGLYTGLSYIF